MGPENQSHKINSDQSVAVATDYYWLQCGPDTPVGVKLQLLTTGGVAIYGNYTRGMHWATHWAPLPRRRLGDMDAKSQAI